MKSVSFYLERFQRYGVLKNLQLFGPPGIIVGFQDLSRAQKYVFLGRIARTHCQMRPIETDVATGVVCVLGIRFAPKRSNRSPAGLRADSCGPGNTALDRAIAWAQNSRYPTGSGTAMRPFAKLRWTFVINQSIYCCVTARRLHDTDK